MPYQSRSFNEDLFLDSKNTQAKMVLGSWKIRGLAQPARFLLEYTSLSYVDRMYEMGDGPEYDKTCWTSVKDLLGFSSFSNFPYLIDGTARITGLP